MDAFQIVISVFGVIIAVVEAVLTYFEYKQQKEIGKINTKMTEINQTIISLETKVGQLNSVGFNFGQIYNQAQLPNKIDSKESIEKYALATNGNAPLSKWQEKNISSLVRLFNSISGSNEVKQNFNKNMNDWFIKFIEDVKNTSDETKMELYSNILFNTLKNRDNGNLTTLFAVAQMNADDIKNFIEVLSYFGDSDMIINVDNFYKDYISYPKLERLNELNLINLATGLSANIPFEPNKPRILYGHIRITCTSNNTVRLPLSVIGIKPSGLIIADSIKHISPNVDLQKYYDDVVKYLKRFAGVKVEKI